MTPAQIDAEFSHILWTNFSGQVTAYDAYNTCTSDKGGCGAAVLNAIPQSAFTLPGLGALGRGYRGPGARRCSFTGDTLVLMADGTRRPISRVEVGDLVAASDPETGEHEPKQVVRTFVHRDTLSRLVVEGADIWTTEDHPFWSATDRRFERAEHLSVGEKVLSASGYPLTVSRALGSDDRRDFAYNLEIDDIHTYHVGARDVLVHNTCGVPPPNLSPPGAGRVGAFNQAKRDSGIPTSMSPTRQLPNLDRRNRPRPGYRYEYDVRSPGGGVRTVVIRDDAGGDYCGPGNPQNRGPHFNTEDGGHYDY